MRVKHLPCLNPSKQYTDFPPKSTLKEQNDSAISSWIWLWLIVDEHTAGGLCSTLVLLYYSSYMDSNKINFCHNLHTLISLQTCMNLFISAEHKGRYYEVCYNN